MAPVYRYCRYKRHYSNPVCVARGMRLAQLIFEFSGNSDGIFRAFRADVSSVHGITADGVY